MGDGKIGNVHSDPSTEQLALHMVHLRSLERKRNEGDECHEVIPSLTLCSLFVLCSHSDFGCNPGGSVCSSWLSLNDWSFRERVLARQDKAAKRGNLDKDAVQKDGMLSSQLLG